VRFLALILLGASCASVPDGAPEPVRDSSLRVHVGERSIGGSDWDPVEQQGMFGLEYVHESPTATAGIEAGLLVSGDTQDDYFVAPPDQRADFRGRTTELSFGLHKEIPVDYEGVHPYFGFGPSILWAELKALENGAEQEDSAVSIGGYVHGGVEFDATAALFVGLDLRLRGGTQVDLVGEDRATGYGEVSVFLGFRF
jgi:hypothetical protein